VRVLLSVAWGSGGGSRLQMRTDATQCGLRRRRRCAFIGVAFQPPPTLLTPSKMIYQGQCSFRPLLAGAHCLGSSTVLLFVAFFGSRACGWVCFDRVRSVRTHNHSPRNRPPACSVYVPTSYSTSRTLSTLSAASPAGCAAACKDCRLAGFWLLPLLPTTLYLFAFSTTLSS